MQTLWLLADVRHMSGTCHCCGARHVPAPAHHWFIASPYSSVNATFVLDVAALAASRVASRASLKLHAVDSLASVPTLPGMPTFMDFVQTHESRTVRRSVDGSRQASMTQHWRQPTAAAAVAALPPGAPDLSLFEAAAAPETEGQERSKSSGMAGSAASGCRNADPDAHNGPDERTQHALERDDSLSSAFDIDDGNGSPVAAADVP